MSTHSCNHICAISDHAHQAQKDFDDFPGTYFVELEDRLVKALYDRMEKDAELVRQLLSDNQV